MEKIRDSFTDKELFRLREEFNDVDADRSGYIDDDELKILLTLLNDSKVPSEDEVRRVMATAGVCVMYLLCMFVCMIYDVCVKIVCVYGGGSSSVFFLFF